MKILHLPKAVGNHGYSLACAERRAGYDSTSLVIGKNPLQMKTDLMIELSDNRLFSSWERLKTVKEVYNKYDIFHFNFCQTILDFPSYGLDYIDLPFYRGIKFVTCNGSDVRQAVTPEENPFSPYLLNDNGYSSSDKIKQRRIAKIFDSVQFGFAQNPDILKFLPADKAIFLPYIKESWFRKYTTPKIRNRKKFVIVHAPTNRFVKGSDKIIDAVERLKSSYSIDFRLIENMSHDEAKKNYLEADLLIDQVRLGWYGGVAVEAMRMGVPVAVYINPLDLHNIPLKMRRDLDESFLLINPDNIYERLANLLDDKGSYNRLKEAAINYVNEHHDPDKVIKLVLEKYEYYLSENI